LNNNAKKEKKKGQNMIRLTATCSNKDVEDGKNK
jgi:hypothetical protein